MIMLFEAACVCLLSLIGAAHLQCEDWGGIVLVNAASSEERSNNEGQTTGCRRLMQPTSITGTSRQQSQNWHACLACVDERVFPQCRFASSK